MGEIVQELVTETSRKAFTDRDLQPATEPQPDFKNAIEEVVAGKADLDYDVHAEILPEFEPSDVSELKLTKPVADIPDEDLNEAIQNLAEQQKSYTARDGRR